MARKNKNKERPVKQPEPVQQEMELVEFDGWYAARSSVIPKQHFKEILWADFASRGVSRTSTMEQFDEALRKYGVKLD